MCLQQVPGVWEGHTTESGLLTGSYRKVTTLSPTPGPLHAGLREVKLLTHPVDKGSCEQLQNKGHLSSNTTSHSNGYLGWRYVHRNKKWRSKLQFLFKVSFKKSSSLTKVATLGSFFSLMRQERRQLYFESAKLDLPQGLENVLGPAAPTSPAFFLGDRVPGGFPVLQPLQLGD